MKYDSSKDGHYVEDVYNNGAAKRAGLKVLIHFLWIFLRTE